MIYQLLLPLLRCLTDTSGSGNFGRSSVKRSGDGSCDEINNPLKSVMNQSLTIHQPGLSVLRACSFQDASCNSRGIRYRASQMSFIVTLMSSSTGNIIWLNSVSSLAGKFRIPVVFFSFSTDVSPQRDESATRSCLLLN